MLESTGELRAICIFDPGLDVEAMGPDRITEYLQTRDFKDVMGFQKKDPRPSIYHLRQIPRSVFLSQVLGQATDHDRYAAAFRMAVTRVENLYSDDGTSVHFEPSGSIGDLTVISHRELERFSPAEILEMGSVAWCQSFLPSRIARRYQVPPTLARTLRELSWQEPAAASQTSAATISSEPSASDSLGPPPIDKTNATDGG